MSENTFSETDPRPVDTRQLIEALRRSMDNFYRSASRVLDLIESTIPATSQPSEEPTNGDTSTQPD